VKQTIKLGIIVLVAVAMVTTGIALAETEETPADEPVAEGPHDGAAYAGLLESLAPLVEDGTITQEQAEAIAEHLVGLPGQRWEQAVHVVSGAAEFLGLTPEEIIEVLREGATLAEIAEANGSSGEELIAYLVGIVEERLTQAVVAGKITEEKKAEALEKATDVITAAVDKSHLRPGGPAHHAVQFVRGTAEFLGLSVPEIVGSLREGATLEEIAEANGSSGEELIAYFVGIVEARLTEAVAAGRITEEQKAEALEQATNAITSAVSTIFERPLDQPRGRFPHGPEGSEPAPEGNGGGPGA